MTKSLSAFERVTSITALIIALTSLGITLISNAKLRSQYRVEKIHQICVDIADTQSSIAKIQWDCFNPQCSESLTKPFNNKLLSLLSFADTLEAFTETNFSLENYSIIATGYQSIGMFDKATEYYIKLARSNGPALYRAFAYLSLGDMVSSSYSNRFKEARNYYENAVELFSISDDNVSKHYALKVKNKLNRLPNTE